MKECPACRRCFPDNINHCPQDGDETTPSLLGEPILDARYQLERRLGQGGMGVVFQARHIFLKTAHAIKIILPDLVGNDPNLVTRFRQEALAAAAIRHQNIIAVTDFGVVRGTMPFLVMEFVKGRSLQDILTHEGAMSSARAFELICPIGAGVAAAHRQNIVHRDLKPLNIMLQDSMPASEGLKILDFGLAKIKSGELLGSFVQAQTSGLMGSPFYMAPEQWSDEEPDMRADIYSLGIILYQMLAGDVPFKGSSIPSIMKKHLTIPPPSFQSLGVHVPPQVEAVVRHALEKEVETRTPSVEALLSELREAISSPGATLKSTRQNRELDPNRTMASSLTPSAPLPSVTQPAGHKTAFDPNAGTISSSALDEEIQQQLNATGEAFRREQQQREQFARDELDREAEARKKADEEAARKRAEEEERLRREREEREEKERQQRDQLERVALQAQQLEEKLARLGASVPPQATAVIDPEATQVQQRVVGAPEVGNNSFQGGRQAAARPQGQFADASRLAGFEQKPKRSMGIVIGAVAVVALLVVAGGIGGYKWSKPKPSAAPVSTTTVGASTTTVPSTQTVKSEPIEIPGGLFLMGRNDVDQQNGLEVLQYPAHSVTVETFQMDNTEVTNAEYALFVKESNYAAPTDWVSGHPRAGSEFLPVTYVSQEDANAFAAWRSKRDGVTYRLPTEQEWEYAARNGAKNDLYPWGNTWNERRAVTKDSGAASPMPVGSYTNGNNQWGVADLIGNVWEWTSSTASLYSGNQFKLPANNKDWIVVRGGSFLAASSGAQAITSTYRDWFAPSTKNAYIGFRLVRSVR